MPTILLHRLSHLLNLYSNDQRESKASQKASPLEGYKHTQTNPTSSKRACMHALGNSRWGFYQQCDFKVRSYCMILRVTNLTVS